MWRTRAALLAAVAVLLVGCGSDSTPSGGGATNGAISGTVTVFAAASLTETFTALGKQFESQHPGTTVRFSFAGSGTLAQQITNGAPADVLATASKSTMDTVVKAGDVTAPTTFATNVLTIAVPPDNPGRIASLADLDNPGVKVELCAEEQPCGAAAATILDKAKLTVKPVSLGQDVKAVLTAVRTGEVDAGLVYVTDSRSAGSAVLNIAIPSDLNVSTSYPIGTVKDSKNAAGAQAFVDFILSPTGKSALAAAGFSTK
jgi:molybdate transport system substrate-binding protein